MVVMFLKYQKETYIYLISGKFKKKDIIFSSNWTVNHLKMFDFLPMTMKAMMFSNQKHK